MRLEKTIGELERERKGKSSGVTSAFDIRDSPKVSFGHYTILIEHRMLSRELTFPLRSSL
jgi:hypothetical protein